MEPIGDASTLPTLGDARRGLVREDVDPRRVAARVVGHGNPAGAVPVGEVGGGGAARRAARPRGRSLGVDETGSTVRLGEDVRALVRLEAAERDLGCGAGGEGWPGSDWTLRTGPQPCR